MVDWEHCSHQSEEQFSCEKIVIVCLDALKPHCPVKKPGDTARRQNAGWKARRGNYGLAEACLHTAMMLWVMLLRADVMMGMQGPNDHCSLQCETVKVQLNNSRLASRV